MLRLDTVLQDELLYKKFVKKHKYKVARVNAEGLVHST